MRLTRHCALLTAALLAAVHLHALDTDPPVRPRHSVQTFLIDIVPYEQPCSDLPVFRYRPPAEIMDAGGFENLMILANVYLQDLEKEEELGRAVDEAQQKMVLNTVNHLRYLIAQTDVEKTVWARAQAAWWTLWWYHAMWEEFEHAFGRRERVKTNYYDRLIPVFPALQEPEQLEVLDAFEKRILCLQVKRRGAFAEIQRHRKLYAEHFRALQDEQRSLTAGMTLAEDDISGETILEPSEEARLEAARVAAAAIGETNATRAYLWLVQESSLHIELYSRLLQRREDFLANTQLHDLQLDALRANPSLMPDDPLPANAGRKAVREQIFDLRVRRAVLHLYLEDMQLEVAFKRSTSLVSTSMKALETARDNGWRVYQGLVTNPDLQNAEDAWKIDAGMTTLGAFAVAFRLAGDLLSILAVQPMVDGFKDAVMKPLLTPMGFEIHNSIDRAYDGYWKSRARLDDRLKVLRKFTPGRADAFISWARTRTEPTETATGLEGASAASVASLLEDSSFVEATRGGLVHIFAALAEDPADLTALYVTGAYFEQRGNAKAGAARIAVNRAIYDVADDGGELGAEVVERIIDPMGESMVNAVDADAWFFANVGYLWWQALKVASVDLVWNAPTRFRLFVAYHGTGAAYEQDDYLRALQARQGEINDLRRMLSDSGFDYYELGRRLPVGYALHIALCETSHEYVAAYRRIRAAYWERQKQWIWARHEDEHSRARTERPPRLSPTGAWAEAGTKTREDMETARLAFREGVLRTRFLAYTGAYDAAAVQLRKLQPVAETYYSAHSRTVEAEAVAAQFADQIAALEAEAVRGEVVAVYDGLYKTVLVETAVSMVSTGLVDSIVGHFERAGRVRLFPPASGGWSTVRDRMWQTLNPWAGKFSQAGIVNLTRNAAIQGFRESVAEAATQTWVNQEYVGVSEASLDQALDFLFSVGEDSVERMGDVLAGADFDWQSDSELYRERFEATKEVDRELTDLEQRLARAGTDEERQRLAEESLRLRARRALITGEASDPEVLDAARSHLAAIEGELLRDRLQEDARTGVLGDDGAADLQSIDSHVYKTLVTGMRDQIHSPAVMAGDIRRLIDADDYLNLGDQLFRENAFDIGSLRRALAQAARNDPQRSVEILAYAMALDQRRAQVAETVFKKLAEDPRYSDTVTVLRETNRVAVIGDDPAQLGSLDTPGIFVDHEYDIVIREGADIDPRELNMAVASLFMEQGYPPPTSEGARNTVGVRTHIQTEAAIRERGRRSGRRTPAADEYLNRSRSEDDAPTGARRSPHLDAEGRPILEDPGKRPSELSEEELRRYAIFDNDEDFDRWKHTMETQQGFKAEHAWHMHLMAQLFNAIIVVRNGNPDSLKYVGLDGYIPKDMTCKAKSARTKPHKGLVVNPRHKFQAERWDREIREASSPAEADELRYHRKRAEETWDKYGEKMFAGDYSEDAQGVIIKRMPDGTLCKGIHGDYDLHEIFVQGEDGRWVRVSFGDGSEDDNALRAGFRAQFNSALEAPLDMYLHGGQGDWDHPGKTADPPVTFFVPKAVTEATGIRSGDGAKTAEDLRHTFENKLGTGWVYSDGHDDLDPLQGIFRDSLYASVGGKRWAANREDPKVERSGDGPHKGVPVPVRGWIPIPMWQAYGLAVDLLPKVGFLADPAYEADAIKALANTTERCLRLEGALRGVDGFLALADAWLISQPAGNTAYNETRRARILEGATDWQRLLAGDVPSTTVNQLSELQSAANELRADPANLEGGQRTQVLRDVTAVASQGEPSLFVGDDLRTFERLVAVAVLGARFDPFTPLGGRTPDGVAEATALVEWMRVKAASMYAEIGASFWSEYERMLFDGVEVEEFYARGEAYRVRSQIERAREEYPDLVLAFLRPPVQSADGRFVPLDPSSLSTAILTDVRSVCEVRRAAAEARRATAAATPRAGVAAFTSAAARDRESEIWDRIQVWVDLAGDTPPIPQSIRTSGM